MHDSALTFEREGAQRVPGIAKGCVHELRAAFAHVPPQRAGVRLVNVAFAPHLFRADGAVGTVAASVLGSAAKPVRAIYFDKSDEANWSLDWHQDRVICVRERADVPGFGPWTIKSGLLHVVPPFELLAKMVTLRVHLDDVGADNAPLLIAPGSHLLGKVGEAQIAVAVADCGQSACLADAGDVWLYATPILHASKATASRSRRRVLQLDYAAFELPSGLDWNPLI